jgi:sodium/proline symporter
MIVVFILSLLLFTGIGILSSTKKNKNTKDYLLANQDVKPWLVALSAVATNNSGFMFLGMIGMTYTSGLQSIWLMIGWITGDLIGSLLILKKIRSYSEKNHIYSFTTLLTNGLGKGKRIVQLAAGLISLIFLSTYSSAQFIAGGKALSHTLDWIPELGILIGAVLVFAYCLAGGIRASIWTDAAQSIVMIFAMFILFVVAISHNGGGLNSLSKLSQVPEGFMDLFPKDFGWMQILLFVTGWIFAGLGVIGQPHIMIRYMTLDNVNSVNKVRSYYYTWFTLFYLLTIGVGLLTRITLPPSTAGFDPELSLTSMSLMVLPDYMTGIILAGIFAATISTADSLIISCTATLANDIFPDLKENYRWNKVFTFLVILYSALIALISDKSVFDIVIYSWAILGTSFGPLLIVKLLGANLRT